MKNKSSYIKYIIIGIIIILVDQITKILSVNKSIILIPNILNITYTQNNGAAFGIGSKYIILFLNIIIIIGLIAYLVIRKKNYEEKNSIVLILSGSIGNLIDRIFRGYVIDFIDVNFLNFPIFNISDIVITLGIFYLLIVIIKNIIKK